MADSSKRRRLIVLAAAAGAAGGLTFYGAYKLYHHPSVSGSREALANLLRALYCVSDAVSSTADSVSLLSSDLHRFLSSDSDRIPTSLEQMAKLARSDEFAASISRASEAVAAGILRGVNGAAPTCSSNGEGFCGQVFDKVLSDDGSRFVSALACSFGRGLVEGLYSGGISDSQAVPWWVELICEDKLRPVIRDCIQTFVGTAVGVYLEKTMDINIYDQIFSGLTNPKHEAMMKDVLVSVCNSSMVTLVRTSHQVLTDPGLVLGTRRDSVGRLEQGNGSSPSDQCGNGCGPIGGKVSSSLAVSDQRKLILDLAGRATFEIVRSFLDFSVQKLYENGRRGVDVVRGPVLQRGMEVLMYAGTKSIIIMAVTVTVCLYIFFSYKELGPSFNN